MNRATHPLKGSIYAGLVPFEGRLDITASTGAVATTSECIYGDSSVGTQGWQYVTTGQWKLTLKEPFANKVFVALTMEGATAEEAFPQIIANNLTSSTPTITIRVTDKAATEKNPTNAFKLHLIGHAVDSKGVP